MNLFVDAGAYIGLLDAADQHHAEAVEALKSLDASRLISSSFVFNEVATRGARLVGAPTTARFLRGLWDREATHMDDPETFLPINAMRKAVAGGIIAGFARRFHGAPTDYSHRKTMEEDAPEILRRVREDGADAALLVAI